MATEPRWSTSDEREKRLLRYARIPSRYWDAEVPLDHAPIVGFSQNLQKNLAAGVGLFLMGPNGSGKTYSAVSLARIAFAYTVKVLYVTGPELIEACIKHHRYNEDMLLEEAVRDRDFLIVDDLGSEYRGSGSGFSELNYLNLLRSRVQNRRCTVFTSNLNKQEVEQFYGAGFFSLLSEACVPVVLDSADKRRDRTQQRKLAERAGV